MRQPEAMLDPNRQPGPRAAYRAAARSRWDGLTPSQMCEIMSDAELNKNARRGGVAAIAEVERRKAMKAYKGEDN